jgi:hypothetical protein
MASTSTAPTTDDDVWDLPTPPDDDPYSAKPYVPLDPAKALGVQTASASPVPANSNAQTIGAIPNPTGKLPWEIADPIFRQYESGNQNVTTAIPVSDAERAKGVTKHSASGPLQMIDSTWQEGTQLAGVGQQYAHAKDAPDDVQDRVAHAIYDKYGTAPWKTNAKLMAAYNAALQQQGAGGAVDTLQTPQGGVGGPAQTLGVGPDFERYQKQAAAMFGPSYDPSQIIPELHRINQEREAAERPLIEARQKRQQQEEAEADQQYERMKRDIDDPALQPWTQKPPQPDPIGGLASLGSVFAALASGFTHTPAIAAMNGMAAAIEARDQGREQDYDQAFKAYQYNANLALKREAIQAKAYDAAWDRVTKNPALGAAELDSVAKIYNDEATQLLLENGQMVEAQKLRDARTEAVNKTAEALAKLDITTKLGPMKGTPEYQSFLLNRQKFIDEGHDPYEAQEMARAIYEEQMRGKSVAGQRLEQENTIAEAGFKDLYNRDPTDADKKSPAFVELQEQAHSTAGLGGPEAVHRMAEKIASYQMPPVSIARAVGASVMAEVAKIAPDYDAKLYSAENKALGNFYGGQEGRSVRSINVAIMHLDTLSDLAAAMNNGDLNMANRLKVIMSQETGQPETTDFNLAKQIVGSEINKAIVPGAGGVGEREEIAKRLNASNSWEQMQGVIGVAQTLLAGQTAGLKQQYTATTGLNPAGFDKLLTDRTKQVLGTSGADVGKARPDQGAGPGPGLPDDARKQLKPNTVTHFGNGQSWTLDASGNPVQVK